MEIFLIMKSDILIKYHKYAMAEWDTADYDIALRVVNEYKDPVIRALAIFEFLISWNWMYWFSKGKSELKVPILLKELIKKIEFVEELDFNLHLDSVDISISENEIKEVFKMFSLFLGSTGASKALHILFPKFFVMWDTKIREAYNVESTPEGYIRFLGLMQKEIKEAIKDFAYKNNLSEEKAREELIKICDGYSPTKLIDEYNWYRYTKGLIL